jgi:predicted dehydrogenase
MKKLKIGIVGIGRIGQRHAKHVNNLAELVAVCDPREDIAKSVAKQYNCKYYLDLDDFLKSEKNLDLVSICTPNSFHAKHTIKALKMGNNVLCEKPMATTVKDCEEMINIAEQTNNRLFIVKQNRFNPPLQALKKAIDENKLGKIINVQLNCFWNRNEEYYKSSDWKGKKELDGGTLFTQFSHFIDLLYWLVGEVEEVKGYTDNFLHKELIEFEDTGVVALKFSNGALGTVNYTVNCYGKNMEGSLTIFGEKGTVKVGGQYLNVLEYQNIENYEIKLEDESSQNKSGEYKGSMSNHGKLYENVIDVFNNKGKIVTSMFDGMKTVQIIEKIYKNARK